jgi:hypothetical protein
MDEIRAWVQMTFLGYKRNWKDEGAGTTGFHGGDGYSSRFGSLGSTSNFLVCFMFMNTLFCGIALHRFAIYDFHPCLVEIRTAGSKGFYLVFFAGWVNTSWPLSFPLSRWVLPLA